MKKVKNEIAKFNKNTIVDELKSRAIDFLTEYSKKKLNESKNDIAKYIEKQVERKIKYEIKKEIRKFSLMSGAYVLFGLGAIFFTYGVFELFFYFLNLPVVFINIIFALFLIVIGWFLYLIS